MILTDDDRTRMDRLRKHKTTHVEEMREAAQQLAYAVDYADMHDGRDYDMVAERLRLWRMAVRRLHLAVAIHKIAEQRRAAA